MLDGLNGWNEVEDEGPVIGPQLRIDLCGSGRHHLHIGGLWEGGRRCPGGGGRCPGGGRGRLRGKE